MVASDSRRARTMPTRSPLSSVIAGAFDRDIGAGAHGDADFGRGQRRRVVDAVAGHGDDAALAAQPLHDRAFAARAAPRPRPRRCRAAAPPPGRGAVVAGQHDDAHAVVAQRFQRLGRRRLDRIGDGDDAGDSAVDRDERSPWRRRRANGRRRLRAQSSRCPVRPATCALPSATLRPSTVPSHALAGRRSRSRGPRRARGCAPRRPQRSPRQADARCRARRWPRAAATRPR